MVNHQILLHVVLLLKVHLVDDVLVMGLAAVELVVEEVLLLLVLLAELLVIMEVAQVVLMLVVDQAELVAAELVQ